MDKKLIIVLSIILFALIGIIFIISLVISGNSSNNEQESTVPVIEETIDSELSNIKNIIENVKINKGGYEYLYNDQSFLDSINKLKALGGVTIVSNIDPLTQTYCLSLVNSKDNSYSCIDNNFIGILETPSCGRDNIVCMIPQSEEVSENNEEAISQNDNILEEEIINNEELVEEEPELAFVEEVTVGSTAISKYKNNDNQEIIFINGKEYGPYSESYITYNQNEWGILMKYNNKWYVNINGKAAGPYIEKPEVEFYGGSLGFSYVKDGKYYVKLSDEVYGPYDDLLEFDVNNE